MIRCYSYMSDRGTETEFFPMRKHEIDENQTNLPNNLARVNQKLGFSVAGSNLALVIISHFIMSLQD